jgi:hypothetical protein
LTSTSSFPNLDCTSAKALSIESSDSISIWIGTSVLAEEGNSFFAAAIAVFTFSSDRPPKRIVYAWLEPARALTVSKPMPVLAPVMRTMFDVVMAIEMVTKMIRSPSRKMNN